MTYSLSFRSKEYLLYSNLARDHFFKHIPPFEITFDEAPLIPALPNVPSFLTPEPSYNHSKIETDTIDVPHKVLKIMMINVYMKKQ